MRMVERLDAGPVILQLGTTVTEDETYGELALTLSELGAAALIESRHPRPAFMLPRAAIQDWESFPSCSQLGVALLTRQASA